MFGPLSFTRLSLPCLESILVLLIGSTPAHPQATDPGKSAKQRPLEDCSIAFSELRQKASSCTIEPAHLGRRCERYDKTQFSEVVAITIPRNNNVPSLCTGTLIAKDWVLSAAHCFIGDQRAEDFPSTELTPMGDMRPVVQAPNTNLAPTEKLRAVRRVLVHPHYSGYRPTEVTEIPYRNDIAVVQLEREYPDNVAPAELAEVDSVNRETTIAGVGYSNADGGTFGDFQLTWPSPLEVVGDELKFPTKDQFGNRSTFCQGDSGGPLFSGRVRGCQPTDPVPERRPRLLEGTISYIQRQGKPPEHAISDAASQAETCRTAEYDVLQNITTQERRNWICEATGWEAQGCHQSDR
jgi:hypothetical protein